MLEENTTLLYLQFDCDDAAGLHQQFIQCVFCNLVNVYVFFPDGRPEAEIKSAIHEALERNESRPGIGSFVSKV